MTTKAPARRLTMGRVNGFKCPPDKKVAFLWDNEVSGFGVKATPTSHKVYILVARLRGEVIRITIGDVSTWLLDYVDPNPQSQKCGARQRASELRTLVDKGIDPREHEAKLAKAAEAVRIEAARGQATVADAWTAYVADLQAQADEGRLTQKYVNDHLALAAPGGEKRKRGTALTMRGPLADLMALALGELDSDCIARWLRKEAKTRPTSTAYAFRVLRAALRWAADQKDFKGLVPADVYSASVVTRSVPRVRAKRDVLQTAMLKPWFESVRKISTPAISAYLQCLLLTGARRGELAGLKWSDVDARWGTMTIKDKVDPDGRILALTPHVASLLADLRQRNEQPKIRKLRPGDAEKLSTWQPSAWVFSSPGSEDGKIAEPRYAHNRALAEGGLAHISLHALRRTYATLAEELLEDVPAGIVAQLMGHKPSATAEKFYKVRSIDSLRRWATEIERALLKSAGLEHPAAQQAGPQGIVQAA